MKKAGKILALTLGAVMTLGVVGMATACGDDNGDKTIIMVWIPEADQEFAKQVAADFQAAHPDKQYLFQWGIQGESDAGNTVLTDVENAADVFSFANDQLNPLVQGDALAPIGGDYLTEMKAQNSADAVSSATVTYKGNEYTYAFPYTDNTNFLYYNTDYFTAEDVQSLDRILEICAEKSTENDTKKFGFPVDDSWYLTSFYFAIDELEYQVTYNESLGETAVSCNFDNEKGLAVTEAVWNYVQNPYFVKSDDSTLLASFQDGSMIAGVSGIWNLSTLQQENYMGSKLGAAKLPTYTLNGEQKQLTAFAGYKLMGVNEYSKVKADAMAFAAFYTNKENQIKHFEARGFVPTNTEAKADPRVAENEFGAAITAQLPYTRPQTAVPTTYWTPIKGLGANMLTALTKTPVAFDCQTELETAVAAIRK